MLITLTSLLQSIGFGAIVWATLAIMDYKMAPAIAGTVGLFVLIRGVMIEVRESRVIYTGTPPLPKRSPTNKYQPIHTAKIGGLTWNRNDFCRGWLATGATGSGKTVVAVNTILHELCTNEVGYVSDHWKKSKSAKAMSVIKGTFNKRAAKLTNIRKNAQKELETLKKRHTELVDDHIAEESVAKSKGKECEKSKELSDVESRIAKLEGELTTAGDRLSRLILKLKEDTDRLRSLKYESYPWGGICMDQKGLFYETLLDVFAHYDRMEDLMLLQTRPEGASKEWKPRARFNLLSDLRIPSNTYANALVKTSQAISGGEGDKGFFTTQAQSNIGWAIEIVRAVRAVQEDSGVKDPVMPNIKLILELLMSNDAYSSKLKEWGALPEMTTQGGKPIVVSPVPLLRNSNVDVDAANKLTECLTHFDQEYWSQPPDQLGGVQGTIYNYLNYFTNDEIAEVFCSDNTFSMDEVERGKVICVSMPQKFAVERRYICTLLKIQFYNHCQRRFDLPSSVREKYNLLMCLQDEAQRFVIDEDKDVDTLREAQATTFLATQGQPSLYPPLGGKEKAKVVLLNLCNRIILQASDDDCANMSSEIFGKQEMTKISHSYSKGGTSKSVSKEDQFVIKPHKFRMQPQFTAVVRHANGKYKSYTFMPISTNGKMAKWWPKVMWKLGHKCFFLWLIGSRKQYIKR